MLDTLGVAVVFVGRVIVTVTVLIRLVDVLNVGGEDDECRDIGWSVRGTLNALSGEVPLVPRYKVAFGFTHPARRLILGTASQ